MLLYIVRHAWAGERNKETWPNDDLRPLTEKGRKRFDDMVKTIADRDFRPELVITSPLVRCRQTAEVIARRVSTKPKLIERKELVPSSDLDGLLAWMGREAPGINQAAWVGHAPDVDEITAALIGEGDARLSLAKGAIAAIEFEAVPTKKAGILHWLVTAKILGC